VGAGWLRRVLVLGMALAFLAVESLALAPGAHAWGGQGCSHCAPLDAHDHDHDHGPRHAHAHGGTEAIQDELADRLVGGTDEPEAPPSAADGCALCRVLAAVPTPFALPPVLPRPEAVPAPPAGASAAFVPACVLDLGLARGPPAPTRR